MGALLYVASGGHAFLRLGEGEHIALCSLHLPSVTQQRDQTQI